MATRLYLPSLGDSPLPSLANTSSAWNSLAAAMTRGPLMPEKADTALTDFAMRFPSVSSQYTLLRQFTSPPLASGYDFDSGDTTQYVVTGKEGHSAVDATATMCVSVVTGDGASVRGVLTTPNGVNRCVSELTSSGGYLTRIGDSVATCATVSAQAGDRIVVEFGLYGSTPNVDYDGILRFGDPSATSDFEYTLGLATDLCPWVELSPDLSFTPEPVAGAGGYMGLRRGMW